MKQASLQIKIASYLADKFKRDASLFGMTLGDYLTTLMNSGNDRSA